MEAAVEFKHPLFQLERNTKHNGQIFTLYPVNASENGDFNRGRKSFLSNTMLKTLTKETERKRSGFAVVVSSLRLQLWNTKCDKITIRVYLLNLSR